VSPDTAADGLTIALILCSALLHASWNALIKASSDPLVNLAVVAGTGATISLPFIIALPWPEPAAWPWLAASGVLHYLYQFALVRAYQLGDLSQVYPIARGLAPLGVAALAAIWAGESLGLVQGIGLGLASLAIMSLSGFGTRGPSTRSAVAMAVVTAALVGSYTYSDGRGVRSVANPFVYYGWSFFLGGVPIVLTMIGLRRGSVVTAIRGEGLRSVGGGVMATIGYTIALWAMTRAPMAVVASLRESSVLFAAFLGARLLHEPFGRRRAISAAVLVAGLVLVQGRWGH
jgi:drug/metabolite transporter (DMT)-like permease